MNKYFCLKCLKYFESEEATECPHCKGTDFTDNVELFAMMKAASDASIQDIKIPENLNFGGDNGVAGSGDTQKAIIKDMIHPDTGKKIGFRYERLDEQTELFGKNFVKLLKGHKVEKTTMVEGTGSLGGYLVPTQEMLDQIIEVAYANSIFLPRANVIPTNTNLLRIPRLAQTLDLSGTLSYFGGISFSWLDEAGTKTETNPDFEMMELTPWKLAMIMRASDELIDDTVINLINYLTGLVNRYFFYFLDNAFLNGNGAAKPLGIINDPLTLSVLRQTASQVHLQDLVNMDARLNELFTQPVWMMRKATGSTLRTDTINSNIIWQDPWIPGINAKFQPPMINGWPVIYNPFSPALGSAGDVVLADLRYYTIAMRQQLSAAQSEHVYFTTDEQALRFVSRVDGEEAVHDAFVLLSASTS